MIEQVRTPTTRTLRVPVHFIHWMSVCALVLACGGCPSPRQRNVVPSRWIRVEVAKQEVAAGQGLEQRDARALKATVPTASTIVTESEGTGTVTLGDRKERVRICGTEPDYLRMLSEATEAVVARGRFLTEADVRTDSDVVVLDAELAETLFPSGSQDSIGGVITIGDREFTVVGILDSARRESILGDVSRDVYVTLGAFDALRPQLDVSSSELDRIWIRVETLDRVPATREIVENLIGDNHPDTEFSVR